jgi:hypothetical protein
VKKIVAILHYLISISIISSAQTYKGEVDVTKVPMPSGHYQDEYTFDSTTDTAAWIMQKKGMHVSFVSTDESWFRSEVPQLEKENFSYQATGWKGERLNMEVLVWSPDTIQGVHFILRHLKNNEGGLLSKNNINVNMVRYVISNYPYGARDATYGGSSNKNVYLLPERFEEFKKMFG